MQIRIHKRVPEDMAVMVDWQQLEPLWLRANFAPLDKSKLTDAYLERWFNRNTSPWSFILGEIRFQENKHGQWEIYFSNGRHRTNLLFKYQKLIPICIGDEVPEDNAIQTALVRPLNEGDIILDMPDLPICSAFK